MKENNLLEKYKCYTDEFDEEEYHLTDLTSQDKKT